MSSSSTDLDLDLLPVRLVPLQLTPSGRPVLLRGEAERLIQDKADLVFIATQQEEQEEEENGGRKQQLASLEDGVVRVTTHRVLWIDPKAFNSSSSSSSSAAAFSIPLSCVARCELRATRLWSSAKTRLYLSCDPRDRKTLVEVSSSSSFSLNPQGFVINNASSSPPPKPFLREVKIVAPNQAAIHSAVQASLAAHEWEKAAAGEEAERAGAAATGSASSTSSPSPPSRPRPQVDDAAVAAVVGMGFSASDASEALAATGGADAQEAALWLLERDARSKLQTSSSVASSSSSSERRGDDKQPTSSSSPSPSPAPSFAGASGVGVGGLLRREERAAAAADAAVEAAFSDLGALMRAAAEMVELARKYRDEARARDEQRRRRQQQQKTRQDASSSSSSPSSSTTVDEADSEADFEDELALLGVIASPVTRAATAERDDASSSSLSSSSLSSFKFPFSTKKSPSKKEDSSNKNNNISLYIRELSAELSDFCQPLVAAAGGVLPLPDVYCLYNRARGTELASPLDVVAAAEAWGSLSSSSSPSPLRLRRLGEGGGVLAVVSAEQCDDGVVCELLAALARGEEEGDEKQGKKPNTTSRLSASTVAAARARLLPAESVRGLGRPLTPSDVAAAMRVPLPVAAAHLATAEAAGALCRDDGDEGVRHFWNFFSSYSSAPGVSSSS